MLKTLYEVPAIFSRSCEGCYFEVNNIICPGKAVSRCHSGNDGLIFVEKLPEVKQVVFDIYA